MNDTIANLINRFGTIKAVVLGDAILDVYHTGEAVKINREAPVPVVRIDRQEYAAGGAANLAVNFARMGASTTFVTVLGDDREGGILRGILNSQGLATDYAVTEKGRKTYSIQRVMAGNHMIVRYDTGSTLPLREESEWTLLESLTKKLASSDVVVFSDYEKGMITDHVLRIFSILQKKLKKPLFIDAKHPAKYAPLHPYFIKPNYQEIKETIKIKNNGSGDRVTELEAKKNEILKATGAKIAAVTLDRDGSLILSRDGAAYRTFARKVENFQAVGAGDTYTSLMCLSLAAGGRIPEAGEIAAAGCEIVVNKKGTATCGPDELMAFFYRTNGKVASSWEIGRIMREKKEAGQKIIFTNGCFDILHHGHVAYLNKAKSLGDLLVVGMNTDESVHRLKGKDRPINTLEERMEVLSGLSSVDYVVPFEDDTPENLIRTVRPDIFVKGGDYTIDKLPEAKAVYEYGGRVEILPYLDNHSTTGIIRKIRGQGNGHALHDTYDKK